MPFSVPSLAPTCGVTLLASIWAVSKASPAPLSKLEALSPYTLFASLTLSAALEIVSPSSSTTFSTFCPTLVMAMFAPTAVPPAAILVAVCIILRVSSAVSFMSLAAFNSLLVTLVCTVLPIVLTVTPTPKPPMPPACEPIEAFTSKLFCAVPSISPPEVMPTPSILVTTLLLRLLTEVAPATPAPTPATPVAETDGFTTAVFVAAILTSPVAVIEFLSSLSLVTSA